MCNTKKITTVLACFFLTLSLNAQFARGLDFDDNEYAGISKKAKLTRSLDAVPASASLKIFTPTPKSQGQHGTCTAWATAYCGRTIVEAIKQNWTDKTYITQNAYSPAFLFRMLEPADTVCKGGSSVSAALTISKEQGNLFLKDAPQICIPSVSQNQLATAAGNKIKDYMRIFDSYATVESKVQAVKKSIAENKPVVIGMVCPSSFHNAKDVWVPTEDPSGNHGGHAMCVIGYDDQKAGGAFEIQNSWGTSWGNEGYIWIKYADFGRFVKYGFEFVDLPEPKPAVPDLSGSIKCVLANGQPMPVSLQVSTRGLTVVPKNAIPAPLTQYTAANAYTSGTRFKIFVSNDQPAFVYAIS